eukprot:Phypoly_transcript_12373.p1 GENE.Phypoly_transcript_12373~~Phypoly_transcript_12373.p1  ORF type:complete len:241 (+),score=31.71 Phypoly_transcript_12373:127-849(+)
MNWASHKKVIETFTILEMDKTNPITVSLINDQSMNGLFYKEDDKVIMGPFLREGIVNADIDTLLQKIFLNSGFLCYSMGQVGCVTAYDQASHKYELDRGGAEMWVQHTIAQPILEGKIWHRRFGTCKNYAPKFSPLPFNVFKGEDQYIYLRDGKIIAVYISACIFNGTNLRTVRVFTVEPLTETTSKASMQFGGLFTDTVDPNQIARAAQGVRGQTFSECSSANGTWLWGEHVTNYLQSL